MLYLTFISLKYCIVCAHPRKLVKGDVLKFVYVGDESLHNELVIFKCETYMYSALRPNMCVY